MLPFFWQKSMRFENNSLVLMCLTKASLYLQKAILRRQIHVVENPPTDAPPPHHLEIPPNSVYIENAFNNIRIAKSSEQPLESFQSSSSTLDSDPPKSCYTSVLGERSSWTLIMEVVRSGPFVDIIKCSSAGCKLKNRFSSTSLFCFFWIASATCL